MEAITLPIYSSEGKKTETVKLDKHVFDGSVNSDAIYQAVLAYQAAQRTGLASTKTMGEVQGGGKKPWRQKGTGRARVGSIRSPLWRHGGVIFGPHPHDFSYCLPAKIKNLALKSALNSKMNEDNLVILDELTLSNAKTKDAAAIFSNLKLVDKKTWKKIKDKNNYVLLLMDKIDERHKRVLRNIGYLKTNLAQNTHAYEVLRCRKLIITTSALSALAKRLK